ncbi:sugar phosphate isomerase/epimerase family protein [Rufibacter glacialis]|uniref:Sugar phosphate isomerase/epimerase n=1 Tax=Rufibacter glacialis TaxID=1259555 RepID=A0A5M8Q629_9BACT|nr:sugar phosphate isomerase/epimerase [Rufibacter glacialis]KAA6430260.1 sugar phosphate isomerase/epimerase [Rufibacter glacialis]GGK87792.1 sugar phosphate isomerase [Rufibacter glacialis]
MNNRRSFLQKLGLLSAGVAFAPALLTSCDSANQKTGSATSSADLTANNTAVSPGSGLRDIGIQLYTLRELLPKDVKGVIGQVAQAGYQDVETYGYTPENGYWGLDAQAFKELLKANNLVSTSGHYEFGQYMKDGNQDIVKRYIDAGKVVGHQYLTVPYLAEDLRNSADAYKNIAEKMNKAAELCKASGLKLAYHNHDFEFKQYGNTTGYDILLQETDPALVSFEADLYWIERAGRKPQELFQQHKGRFVMWHVKDMDKTTPSLNTEIGTGSIDYPGIFAQAKVSGVDRIFVEQENFAAGKDPIQSIKQSRDYVKNTLLA